MHIFRFDASSGHRIDRFGSVNLIMSPIQRSEGPFQLGCMHLGPGGLVGGHHAVGPQLFLIVNGVGWVRSQDSSRVPISAGQAAYWADGEWHESGSDIGMDVIVLEADTLDPAQYMREEQPHD